MRQFKLTFIVTLLLLSSHVLGQKDSQRTFQIDTLDTYGDSTLVKITFLENNNIKKICNAFLLADCMQLPRIILFGRGYFKKKTYAPIIIPHGLTTEYKTDGKTILTTFQNGKKVKTTYLDKNSNEISEKEFKADEPLVFICVTQVGYSHLILRDKKKGCP